MDVDNTQHLDPAQRYIHLDLGKAAAEGEGIIFYLTGGLSCDMNAVLQGVESLHRQIRQGEQRLSGGGIHHVSPPHIQSPRLRQQPPGVVQKPLPEELPCLFNGVAGDIRLTGGVSPCVKGSRIGVLYGDDMYVLGGDADGLRGHLGKDSVAPLSDFGGAKLQLYRTVLVENQSGRRGLQRNGIHAGLIGENRHAHSPADRSGLVLIFLPQLIPADPRPPLLHAFPRSGGVAGDAVERVHITQGHQVLIPEFIGIQVHFPGNILHHTLQGKVGLGDAVPPHGPRRGPVGVDGIGLAAVRQPIQVGLPEPGNGVGRDGVPMGGVAPLVGHGHTLPGHQVPIPVHSCAHIKGDGVAGAGILESLLPCELQLDAASAHLRTQPGVERLVEHLLFITEPAPHAGLDHPYLSPGNPQRLTDNPAHDMRDLGGGNHREPAALHIGIGDRVLQMTVLDLLGLVMAVKRMIGLTGEHILRAAEV